MLESFSLVFHNSNLKAKKCAILSLHSELTAVDTDTRILSALEGRVSFLPSGKRKGSESYLTEIRIRKGETLDRALRRLKKRLDRENVIKDARNNRYYEKPSVRKRRKMKVAKFTQMLKTRYADA